VFAIGDMALLNKLPGVAQPAIQEGKYVGNVIKARLAGRDDQVKPFKYFDKGSMATIGHKYAVADAFGRKFTGVVAYGMWGLIHVMYLVGWGNRLGTIYTWSRALYFSKNRGHRIITFEQANLHDRHGDRIHRAIVPHAARTRVEADSSLTAASQALPPGTQQTG
jgi:NADH dehydrogenase